MTYICIAIPELFSTDLIRLNVRNVAREGPGIGLCDPRDLSDDERIGDSGKFLNVRQNGYATHDVRRGPAGLFRF